MSVEEEMEIKCKLTLIGKRFHCTGVLSAHTVHTSKMAAITLKGLTTSMQTHTLANAANKKKR